MAVSRSGGVLLAAMLVTLAGCSDGRPARYPVTGSVRFESGTPVRNASIEFVPSRSGSSPKGPSPRGRIDRDGRFTLSTYDPDDGAPAGDYRVVVAQTLPPDAEAGYRRLGEEHAKHAGKTPSVSFKHASPSTTGLMFTVEPIDANEFEIVVEPQ